MSSILGVVLEDERLEVFLLSLDLFVFCIQAKRIYPAVEREEEEPIDGHAKIADVRRRAGHFVHCQHKETEENDHSIQSDCAVPLPKRSEYKRDKQEGQPYRQ